MLRKYFLPGLIPIALFLLGLSPLAQATSVQEFSLGEILASSELVFEGKCIAVRSEDLGNGRLVQTIVTFSINEVISGDYAGDTIELKYLGGVTQNRSMEVSEMKIPQVNDAGIFFVESLNKQLVNPLYGWQQGHISIRSDNRGVRKVGSADNKPIAAVRTTQASRVGARRSQAAEIVISKGVARGVEVSEDKDWSKAMSVEAFKGSLRDMLNSKPK